ncbi:MAG: glutamine--fructose-6-phosphate aminotransferase, partial [Ferrovum sp.]|nr:glutamine--fructose-6-phosphate aminotransferase [Ferrovum sp.]
MCGIVGAVARRNVVPLLLEGLKRLEYRGYDSAGLAIISNGLHCVRSIGRVAQLEAQARAEQLSGELGIAHTRWATHGAPNIRNAHPHVSRDGIAVVHNGIIENYETLRRQLQQQGYVFESETDTEVIAHLVHSCYAGHRDLARATCEAVVQLQGAY